MGQILVWECERTGKLFRDKAAYSKHLTALRLRDKAAEKERQRIAARDALDAAVYHCESFAEVEAWLVANWGRLQDEHGSSNGFCHVKSIRFSDMVYKHDQSNTHSAPRGQPRNWGCDDNLPRGYAGWRGRIDVEYTGSHHVSDLLHAVNVCTGTGGGGSYDVTLWEDDFPNLRVVASRKYPTLSALTTEGASRVISYMHDVANVGRMRVTERAQRWYDLEKKAELLDEHGIARTADNKIDRLAHAFGETEWCYYVNGRIDSHKAELYENHRRIGTKIPILPLGPRMWQMRDFLMEDADVAIEWKLSGELTPDTEIIDLKKRLERLLLEDKFSA